MADFSDACMANCSSQADACKRVCPTTYNVPCLSACDSQAQTCRQSCRAQVVGRSDGDSIRPDIPVGNLQVDCDCRSGASTKRASRLYPVMAVTAYSRFAATKASSNRSQQTESTTVGGSARGARLTPGKRSTYNLQSKMRLRYFYGDGEDNRNRSGAV